MTCPRSHSHQGFLHRSTLSLQGSRPRFIPDTHKGSMKIPNSWLDKRTRHRNPAHILSVLPLVPAPASLHAHTHTRARAHAHAPSGWRQLSCPCELNQCLFACSSVSGFLTAHLLPRHTPSCPGCPAFSRVLPLPLALPFLPRAPNSQWVSLEKFLVGSVSGI